MKALLGAVAVAAFALAVLGCGGGDTRNDANSTNAQARWLSLSTARVCPARPAPLTQALRAAPAEKPVVPEGVEEAWACLYTHGEPLNGENGQSLAAGGEIDEQQLAPILDAVSSLPPSNSKPCTAVGGGLLDALVLVNSSGEVFPMLVEPTPPQVPYNCGVVSTPKGYLELGESDRINRLLFQALGQPFPP
jgi:hypothetical protein